jgi:hypothetical protein
MRGMTRLCPVWKLLPILALLLLLGAGGDGGASLPDASFVIPAGAHKARAEGAGLTAMRAGAPDRTVRFEVRFPEEAAYRTKAPGNQADWNKVMGLSTLLIHRDSIRLGWRYLPGEDRMELGFYGYLAGERRTKALTRVKLGAWTLVELRMRPDGLRCTAGGSAHQEQGAVGVPDSPNPTWVLRTAYFGGDETAPHDVPLDVRRIRID